MRKPVKPTKPIKTTKPIAKPVKCVCPSQPSRVRTRPRKPRGRSRVSRGRKEIGEFHIPFTSHDTKEFTDPVVAAARSAGSAAVRGAGTVVSGAGVAAARAAVAARTAGTAAVRAGTYVVQAPGVWNANRVARNTAAYNSPAAVKQRADELARDIQYKKEYDAYQRGVIEYDRWNKLTAAEKQAEKHKHPMKKDPLMPDQPNVDMSDEWRRAKVNTKQWAARQATPAGMYRAAAGGVNAAYGGMVWLEEKRLAALAAQAAELKAKQDAWVALPRHTREELLEEQAFRNRKRQELSVERQRAESRYLDETTGYITGQKYRPKVYKVEGGETRDGYAEDKYLDEYGNEMPGIPQEIAPKRKQRSENQTVNDLFGGSSGGPVAYIPSPLDGPPQIQSYGGEEPRRRQRYSQVAPEYTPSPQPFSSQRRIVGNTARKEMDAFRDLLM